MKFRVSLSNCLVVAKYSFLELIKSKMLLYVAILGLCALGLILLAKELTYQTTTKVALDVGLGMLGLSCNIIALFLGASLVSKEIESRTIYMIISRPISRSWFLVGKFLGLSSYLLVNVLILSILTLSAYFFAGGDSQPLIYWNLLFVYVESLLLLTIVLCFSLITNVHLTVLFSLVFLGVGHAIPEALSARFVQIYPELETFLKTAHLVFPAFYKLNIKDFVLYQHDLAPSYLWGNLAYGILYMIGLVFISSWIFERKNLD